MVDITCAQISDSAEFWKGFAAVGDTGDPKDIPSICLHKLRLKVKHVDARQSSIPLIIFHGVSAVCSSNEVS